MTPQRSHQPSPKRDLAQYPELRNLPPSATFVWDVLDVEGPLTHRELEERTALPKRTIRRAVQRLHEYDLVSETPTTDGRIRRYEAIHP